MRRLTKPYTLLFFLLMLLAALPILAQTEEPPTNIAIIMDASGSMQALVEQGQTRIAIARDEIISLSGDLSPTVNASLWIYGHRLPQSDPAASCLDIEEVIPLGVPDAATFTSVVSSVDAIGYTPIATSLGMAYSSLPADERDIIVLMSDGEESCGGDPCAVAAALDERNIELRIHTIGFAPDAGTRAQLQCIADATGGDYFEAQDTEGLRAALRTATAPVTGTIAVVRSDGEIAAGVGFTVVTSTGDPAGSVVGSGSFEPGDYNVTVNTEPPLQATVTVVAGETVTITLPDLGQVRVVDANGTVLDTFPITAYTPGTTDVAGFGSKGIMELPPGTYEVEVGSRSQERQSVTITGGDTVDIVISSGDLQIVDAEGNPTDTYPFYVYSEGTVEVVQSSSTGLASLQAGTYDVEVATTPPLRATVTITAGETTELALPGIGTLEVVDEEGTPVTEYSFYVSPADGERYTTTVTDGTVDLIAGIYMVDVATNPPVNETVTITAGETTQIVLPSLGMLQVIDAAGNPTDAYAMYIYAAGTDQSVASGFGSVNLAAGTYDVQVYTNPTIEQTVVINGGETTSIQVGGMGMIQIVNTDGSLNDDYAFYVTTEGNDVSIVSGFGSAEIAAGTYDIEVYISPILSQTITVSAGETTDVVLPTLGSIEIVDSAGNQTGDYVFYVYEEGGGDSVTSGFESAALAAGTYDIEIYTNPVIYQTITVAGGEPTQFVLPPIGILQLVDGAGNPTDSEGFTVYPVGSDDFDYAAYVLSGTVSLIADDYEVAFDSDSDVRYPVTITADETTEITLPE